MFVENTGLFPMLNLPEMFYRIIWTPGNGFCVSVHPFIKILTLVF